MGPNLQPADDAVRHAEEACKKLDDVARRVKELADRLEEAETGPFGDFSAPDMIEEDHQPGAAAGGKRGARAARGGRPGPGARVGASLPGGGGKPRRNGGCDA